MSISLIQVFTFVLALTGILSGAAVVMNHRQGERSLDMFLELSVWSGCLVAVVVADYLLHVIEVSQAWV